MGKFGRLWSGVFLVLWTSCDRILLPISACVVEESPAVQTIEQPATELPAPEQPVTPTAELPTLTAPAGPATSAPVIAELVGPPVSLGSWVTSVAIAPDSRLAAAGGAKVVVLFELATRQEVRRIAVPTNQVRGLAFSADGATLWVGGYQQIAGYEVGTGVRKHELKGHRGLITGLTLSPSGKWLASSSTDETSRIWDIATGTLTQTLTIPGDPVQGVAWSPDETLLATAAGDPTRTTRSGQVHVWNVASGAQVLHLTDHQKTATAVAFSSDGTMLLSAGFDERVIEYQFPTGQPIGAFKGHTRPINGLALHPNGKTAISGSGGQFKGNHEVLIWNLKDGAVLTRLDKHTDRVTSLAISPDGQWLVTGSYDETVLVWRLTGLPEPAPKPMANPSAESAPNVEPK